MQIRPRKNGSAGSDGNCSLPDGDGCDDRLGQLHRASRHSREQRRERLRRVEQFLHVSGGDVLSWSWQSGPGVLGFSIVAKETLYRVTKRIGEKNNSSVLVANAYHHRSDVWASVVALAGLGGAYMGYVCERLHEERFVAGSRGRHRGGRIDREDGSGPAERELLQPDGPTGPDGERRDDCAPWVFRRAVT